ncbi:hypothetical protein A3B45_03150 [Candidatus Daviesbacteria bacterium RIFCSPLOWO2_01_FULL_39_12]|uniref:Uncharacterized protein n=1 Tax=Candidatus Daviesbacteria bacterium RIFCSPLOWO2_01_FULL_39_12 TaxID=1797785 RepID=A0A1F5KT69_9BACT|nr:MAG: hypothetical protein A3D79_00320 [Candidatus Daviesbacteria bacterium RIFCSPHIGHO2_02_FULL_39_8]OGE44015.1 MAG: hypothetical protein A3B45_03150 [Candidatus Daviesbacteria bacterium RIFCSPLOWO2_01_FULL_39_12]
MAVFGIFVSLSFSIVAPVIAKGPNGSAGESNKAHLYLYEKDSSTWDIAEGGAWGKMTYNQSGPAFDYVFNGHSLVPGDDYTLIYYPDPWPGTNLQCLGSAIANVEGDVHISGAVDTGSLPTTSDANYYQNWNLDGVWGLDFNSTLYSSGNSYAHSVTISGSTATGSSTGNTYTATVSVIGNSVTIVATYLVGSAAFPYSYTAIGTISGAGTLSGTWSDTFGDSGTWSSTSGAAVPNGGAKIWLVESDDVECDVTPMMVAWNPTEYLFENNLISFTSP